ncbi:hypothetical protein Gogos_018375 [Gossypium gossypioides]|uniref:RNase H type-1 domain-containing protein n=1 Tax=Gossypium gossypioides TaxID=34282 RepID=A0A7J9BDX6_GOSGO|nr:hypothetical protein [Gossypium gossypioides]
MAAAEAAVLVTTVEALGISLGSAPTVVANFEEGFKCVIRISSNPSFFPLPLLTISLSQFAVLSFWILKLANGCNGCFRSSLTVRVDISVDGKTTMKKKMMLKLTQDKLIWHHSKDGRYSVRTSYRVALELNANLHDQFVEGPWSWFWSCKFHQRLKTLFGDVFEVFCQQKLTWLREVSMWLSRVLDVERSRISIMCLLCVSDCGDCFAISEAAAWSHAANTPWLRPPLGFLKCNVNEAWFEDHVTTNCAALLRDSHGHVVKCFIGIAQSVMDPSIVKAFVVREALSWLRSFNVDWILMELDSSSVPKQDLVFFS